MKTTPLIFAIVSSFLFSAPAWAKHWHEDGDHWKTHSKTHEARDDDDREVDHRAESCYFEPRDVRVMSEYYAPRYRRLPPDWRRNCTEPVICRPAGKGRWSRSPSWSSGN
jgi:hypothetical protein